MAERIVLFGATGYTGRLTAAAMVARGLKPVLAARDRARVEALAAELGGLEARTADVADPPSVAALVEPGEVLVSTVGPFTRFGAPAAAAASARGVHYIDSTGEPPFIREVFERYGVAAERAGCGMLTAFGYDFVPGNLAGAIALEEAGEEAVRVDVGYFVTGRAGRNSISGGTQASLLAIANAPGFAFRDGRVCDERASKKVRSFPVGAKQRQAISVPASEHFGLPRLAPQLREVNAYLGWFGPASRVVQGASAVGALAMKLPGAEGLWSSASERLGKGSSGGPDADTRAQSGSHITALAYDASGRQLSEVHVSGIDAYTFTGRILAWGADRVANGALRGVGALGPVDAFGLEELRQGCAEAGLAQEGYRTPSSNGSSAATAATAQG
ncbi:MAG TPA: saccharopine dehydrogenase NADP-binding domain-containing protein [Thermoleophilaceae bacterium]